jgi:phosphoribosylamine--glycine ligase
MNILVIGSGGREHALAWKLAQSPLATKVYVAPGNAGTALEPNMENVPIDAENISALLAFAKERGIDFTLVGPEAPLVDGIVDRFTAAGLKCFGPTARAARLEGSKSFTKEFLKRHSIPTANSATFVDLHKALTYLSAHKMPIVIKADGLAAGKGVVVAQTREEAEAALRDMLSGQAFGEAGEQVVIEDYLEGEEASFIIMADGKNILPMATSQDHKRIGDGDRGPNTGGMGACSPTPVVDGGIYHSIMNEIVHPTMRGLAAEGMPYSGFLYIGLMVDEGGHPKVIEFNCRFGDPETQPILMRLKSDLLAHCLAALDGRLDQEKADWDPRPAIGVVLAAGGYPGDYEKGLPISGLPQDSDPDAKVFHAGTRLDGDQLVTNGGRVLCVTALGDDLKAAQQKAYQLAEGIQWPGIQYRRDIGHKAL